MTNNTSQRVIVHIGLKPYAEINSVREELGKRRFVESSSQTTDITILHGTCPEEDVLSLWLPDVLHVTLDSTPDNETE